MGDELSFKIRGVNVFRQISITSTYQLFGFAVEVISYLLKEIFGAGADIWQVSSRKCTAGWTRTKVNEPNIQFTRRYHHA
jgi:hypothetical protein